MTELLVTIAITGIITAVSVVAFMNIFAYQTLRAATTDVYTALSDARARTLAAENDAAYGIHITATSVVRYRGPTYIPGDVSNTVFAFPGSVSATTTLVGGTTNILFARLSGESSVTGTITLTSLRSGATSTVIISESGLIEVEE